MSKLVRTFLIIGLVGAAAAAAAGGYYLYSQQNTTPPVSAPASAPAPAPQTTVSPPPPPPAEKSQVSDQDVATVNQFSSLVQPFTLVHDSQAFWQASTDSPPMYPLRAGTSFVSVEQSKDGRWDIALTKDGQSAYLPAADVGPYDASKAAALAHPSSVSGNAVVVDTATLNVEGQTVQLAGVIGESGDYADAMQAQIDASGHKIDCALKTEAGYTCLLPNGQDLARLALFNGAARPADDASADYRKQADAAKAAHKGVWR
jgi:hypothetical protein